MHARRPTTDRPDYKYKLLKLPGIEGSGSATQTKPVVAGEIANQKTPAGHGQIAFFFLFRRSFALWASGRLARAISQPILSKYIWREKA